MHCCKRVHEVKFPLLPLHVDVVAPSLVGPHAQKETGSFRLDAV
jgi:hypothetical protein